MKNIRIEGRKWFDKVNGNTYHSARVYVDGELVAAAPFQYGYGDQYLYSGMEAAKAKLGWDFDPQKHAPRSWADSLGAKLFYESADFQRKRDVVAWGQI